MKKITGNNIFKLIIIIVLLLNSIMLARMLGDIYLPGELSALEKAKDGAQSVINYSEDLARSYGVAQKKSVRDILSKFIYEIEKADNAEEVASLMVDYGRQVQNIIFRELQNKRINKILNIVNKQKLPEKGNITITSIEGEIKFVDPHNILTKETKKQLKELSFNQTVELEIKEKRARLLTTESIFNQVDFLQTRVASLKRQLDVVRKKAGYEEITGPGIIIKVYDQKNKVEETGIVHDSDLRNIINELLVAGARGIEVGGQRLTALSSIRCVGPTVMVNNKPIEVNPVIIKVIGKPQVLKSSLDIVKNQLQAFGIDLKIIIKKELILNEY